MKIAVHSRRLFSICRHETLSDPATIVTDQYGVQSANKIFQPHHTWIE